MSTSSPPRPNSNRHRRENAVGPPRGRTDRPSPGPLPAQPSLAAAGPSPGGGSGHRHHRVPAALTLVLTADRGGDSLATALSSYLVLVVVVAAIGGVWPAALAAVAGFLLSNYYFAPPFHSFTIADARDILALIMFLVTAGVVSVLVDLSARRSTAAIQARTDARMLARVAGRMVSPEGNPLPALLGELMVAFRLDGASVLRTETGRPADRGDRAAQDRGDAPAGTPWELVASAGRTTAPPTRRGLPGPAPHRAGGPGAEGPRPDRRGSRDPVGLRRSAGHRPGERQAARRGGRSRFTGPGQPAAYRAARRRQSRPPDAAGLDQGGVVEPALRAAHLRTRGDRDPDPDHRRRSRPSERHGREPARHEPTAGRLDGHPRPELRGRRDRRGRRRQPRARGGSRSRWRYPRRSPASGPTRCCSSGRWSA